MVGKRFPTENPICSPNKSLAHPMSHGPSIPSSPENVKSIPRMVFVFFGWSTDTAAVKVGKMIEKKRPVSGRKMLRSVNVPMVMHRSDPMDANKIDRKYPSL